MQRRIAVYLAMDTETAGLLPKHHSLLTAHYIVLNEKLEEIADLSLSVKHDTYVVNMRALEVNHIDLPAHDRHATERCECIRRLREFLLEYVPGDAELVPLGHNIHFDL